MLHGELLKADCVDEIFVAHAPKLAGGRGPGLTDGLDPAVRPLEVIWLAWEPETDELFARYRVGEVRLDGRGDHADGLGPALAAAEHPEREQRAGQDRRRAQRQLDAQDALAGPVDVAKVEQERGLVKRQAHAGAERDGELLLERCRRR